MKNTLKFVICFLLLSVILLMAIGCKKEKEPDSTDSNEMSDTEPITPIVEGKFDYCVVYDEDSKSARQIALDFCKAVELVTGTRPEIKSDYENKDNNADIKEILIGTTDRAESETFNAEVGVDEFGVKVIGNKIVLSAYSDKALRVNTELFLKDYFGYSNANEYENKTDISIPGDLNKKYNVSLATDVAVYVTNDQPTYVDSLISSIRNEYKSVDRKSIEAGLGTVFNIDEYDIVIVAGADVMPVGAGEAITEYMGNGGRVLMLGGPAFESIVAKSNGQWLEENEFYVSLVKNASSNATVLDTSKQSILSSISQSTNNTKENHTLEIKDCGLAGSSAQLYFKTANFTNWDTLSYSPPVSVRVEGCNYFGFWAKDMDGTTGSLSISVTTTANKSYYTVVKISTEWNYYLVPAEDFVPKGQTKPVAGDAPDLGKILTFGFGLDSGNFYKAGKEIIKNVSHSFAIAEPMVAKLSASDIPDFSETTLNHMAPMYELYPITNGANILTEGQTFVSERNYVLPSDLYSCYAGTTGAVYNKGINERFIPLLRVTNSKGLHSGYAAWLTLNCGTTNENGELEGSMLGCFSI